MIDPELVVDGNVFRQLASSLKVAKSTALRPHP